MLHGTRFARAIVTVALTLASATAMAASDSGGNERFRTLWHGQWVDYVEIGDFAVTEGDIIIGPKDAVREWTLAVERGTQQMTESRKALTIDASSRLWLRAASGVIEIPFAIEAGNATNINAAVAEVNRALAGVVQWVPYVAQPDYVNFNATAANSGACSSSVGRVGGKQQILGDPECGVSTFVHEMGHAMGLWHVQQDADANAFVDLKLSRMDPAKRANNLPIFGTRTIDGYDYGSIMHYSRTNFPAYADRVTLETKPAGIDVGVATTYSAADVDALQRLYGAAPTRTTVTSNPPGMQLMIDGVATITPAVFDWPIGSVHRVWATADRQAKDGFQFAFGRWNHDAGATPSNQLTWQVTGGDGSLGNPAAAPSSTVLTANFVRLIDVTAVPTAQVGGTSTVTPRVAPWPGTASLYPQYSSFDMHAAPSAGYMNYFTWGSAFAFGGGAGILPDLTVLLSGALSAQTVGAGFHNGPTIAVNATGDGILDGISVTITSPGGAPGNSIAPRIARTTAGTWKFVMSSPQIVGSAIRHILDSYDGFDTPASGEVAMPASGVRTVTIRAHRELAPYKQVIPACAGSIALSDSSAWVRYGSSLGVTLTPSGSAIFAGWTGTVSGTATSLATTVGAAIPEFVANFNSVSEALSLSSVSTKIVGDDSSSVSVTLQGTGFSGSSLVVVAGVVLAPTFIDGHTLRVTISRSQFSASGRTAVYVSNNLGGSCTVASNSLAMDILPAGKAVAVTLTEYYHAALDYYFLTGRAGDKTALDGFPAIWARTGKEIKLYAAPNVNTLPLERHYFDKVARGGTRGSHFFTALASDQALMTSLNPTNLQLAVKPYLEGVEGYAVPKNASGACPSGTTPIYRAFKGTPRYVDDGNHRFSTNLAQHQDMVTRLGWTDEGIVFCGL